MPLFRAHCKATGYVDPPAFADLPHVEWEGGLGGPRLTRYYFLVEALTPEAATAILSDVLAPVGNFNRFGATGITPPAGWQGLNKPGVDWASVATRCDLSALDQTLLESLLDGAESTSIVVEDPATGGDRQVVEAGYLELERRGLVTRTPEGDVPDAGELPDGDTWWMITDRGWETLGLIKRPWYH
ncbi:MAG: hypothetical protein WCB67_10260 [Solirubrobacteraceae bacterium]